METKISICLLVFDSVLLSRLTMETSVDRYVLMYTNSLILNKSFQD